MTDLESRVENLERLVGFLLGKNSRKAAPEAPPETPTWRLRTRSGGTYTPGADWRPQFFDPSASYIETRVPCGDGTLITAFGADHAWYASITFTSDTPFQVTTHVDLNPGAASVVQVQDNGRIQEISSSGTLDLAFRRGHNSLVVMGDGDTQNVTFTGRILDGKTSRWTRL